MILSRYNALFGQSPVLHSCWRFFFFLSYTIFIYLFIYLWLCWVFVSVRGLSLVAASGGRSLSRCTGLSLSRPLLLRSTGSRCAGSVIVAHGPSFSAACGIFPDQGSNPCPLHWQADSQPLRHQGSPLLKIFKANLKYHHFTLLQYATLKNVNIFLRSYNSIITPDKRNSILLVSSDTFYRYVSEISFCSWLVWLGFKQGVDICLSVYVLISPSNLNEILDG